MTTATVLFLDLSRCTALTDVHGDHAAVGAVGRRDRRHGSEAERRPDLVRVFTMPEANPTSAGWEPDIDANRAGMKARAMPTGPDVGEQQGGAGWSEGH